MLFKQGATTEQILQGNIDAYMLLHLLNLHKRQKQTAAPGQQAASKQVWQQGTKPSSAATVGSRVRSVSKLQRAAASLEEDAPHEAALQYVATQGTVIHRQFADILKQKGWLLPLTVSTMGSGGWKGDTVCMRDCIHLVGSKAVTADTHPTTAPCPICTDTECF